jgi:hypothetical protein
MHMISRRQFLRLSAAAGAGLAVPWQVPVFADDRDRRFLSPIPGGSLDPTTVPKYVTSLVKPPAMPNAGSANQYEIAVRQFQQHILPTSMGLQPTTVWS